MNGGITISAAAAIGQNIYLNRPVSKVYQDVDPRDPKGETLYLKNFHVANTPEMAFNIGLWYRAPKFWSFSFNFNYFHATYADINFDRRTIRAVSYLEQDGQIIPPTYQQQAVPVGSELWNNIIHQEEMPGNFSADIFIRKSWKVKNFYFILGVGMSNILNNRAMATSGFEQFRFDYLEKNVDKFPSKYYYAYGTNYMISLTFRM